MPAPEALLHFEDFTPGATEAYGGITVTEAEMLDFARDFDPQPMHLDPASDQAARVGGLIASGWHTAAMNMRMMADHFILRSAGLGSPGVASLKWLAPVRAGDRLSGTMTVLDKRASASKPDRGFVNFRFALDNQSGERVLEQENLIMYALRNPGVVDEAPPGALPRPPVETFSAEPTGDLFGYIEDITPDTVVRFGSHRFEAETMIRFATRFDPQAFHLSEEAGKATHFGGLSASGWHTSAAWMRTAIDYWRAKDRPGLRPKRGPGFGFRDLRWIRPVLAGDTLTYYARVIEARRSASKPGWGIVTQRNYALNQHGIPVFAFTGSVLWEARP